MEDDVAVDKSSWLKQIPSAATIAAPQSVPSNTRQIPSRSIGKFRSHKIAIDMQMTKVVGAIGVSGWLWKSKAAEKLEADAPSVDRSITNAAKAESPAQPSHDRWGSRPSSLARAELQ